MNQIGLLSAYRHFAAPALIAMPAHGREFGDFCGFSGREIAVFGVRLPALLQELRGAAGA